METNKLSHLDEHLNKAKHAENSQKASKKADLFEGENFEILKAVMASNLSDAMKKLILKKINNAENK